MDDIEERVSSYVKKAAGKLSPETYLSGVVRRMDRGQVDVLATAYLLAQVKLRKRSVVARVERESARPNRGTKAWYTWLDSPEGAAQKDLEIEYEREDDERKARWNKELIGIIQRHKEELRMEWNDELLRSDFALADGTKVTWGDASREQHEWRVDMHEKNAAAGIEGAARHRAAISLLDQSGSVSLNAAIKVAA
jgi:hypothetical protein